MQDNNTGGAHTSEPVATGAQQFADWLTVQEAVAYCLFSGLHRTPKTVRKWAQRARDPDSGSAEIAVKAQDTGNGFRWLIERTSLDVKIAQELDFDARKNKENDEPNLFAPVATGAHTSEPVHVEETSSEPVSTHEHLSAPVHTDAHAYGDDMIAFLKNQIETKDQQIAVKDQQIASMLERDRETNILIQGLQTSLTQVVHALPRPQRDDPRAPLSS